MKKLNKKIIKLVMVSALTTFCFISCLVEKTGVTEVYQIKNSTDSQLTLKFYYKIKPWPFSPDSIVLGKRELSPEFTEIKGGADAQSYFIFYTDSIDILSKEKILLKRYYHTDVNKVNVGKTVYSTDSFDKDSINSKGQTVHIYSILSTDFPK